MIQKLDENNNYSMAILSEFLTMHRSVSESKCYWVEGDFNLREIKTCLINNTSHDNFVFYTKLHLMDRSLLKPFRDFLIEHKSIWSKWECVKEYKSEIQTLFPQIDHEVKEDVFSISWSWSEVRLNREAHWSFRLIHFISIIIKKLAEIKPIAFLMEDWQNSDRMSIYCINHLLCNLKLKNLIVVLNVKDYDSLGEQLDNRSGLKKTFRKLKNKIQPIVIVNENNVYNINENVTYTTNISCLNDDIKDCVNSLEAGRANYHDVLNKLHHTLVLFNLENVLLLSDIIFKNLDQFSAEQQQRLSYEIWRHVGIAQVFMDEHNQAIHSFNNMEKYSNKIGEQVKACHLIATVYGKRINNINLANKYVQKGLRLTKNSVDFRTLYEKGWLYNYLAYISYSVDKNFDVALNYIKKASEFIKPFKDCNPDSEIMDEIGNPISAERLLGNLTANEAYLNYYIGSYDKAIELWRSLKIDIKNAPEVFKKEYYYFEGNLLSHLNDYDNALVSLIKSYSICKNYHDTFHQEIVSRKIGFTYFLIGEFSKALAYYELSFLLKNQLGKKIRDKDYQSIILCHLLAGDNRTANQRFIKYIKQIDETFVNLFNHKELHLKNSITFMEEGPFILLEPFPPMNL